MLAEPKTKRGRGDGSPQDMFSPLTQVGNATPCQRGDIVLPNA